MKTNCPVHKIKLVGTLTGYGMRYDCPEESCTIMCWGGRTSTPADDETRAARRAAHSTFDKLWKSGKFSRQGAYKRLAKFMHLTKNQTHIGDFNLAQCQVVYNFVMENK